MFNLSGLPNEIKTSAESWVRCKKTDDTLELAILEEIGEDAWGDGFSSTEARDQIKATNGQINVAINSPGGFVYDGMVIYNALAAHPGHVTVTIEGLAFSAASFIAMAGDTIRMFEASNIGIHRGWTVAMGNAKAMRAAAEWLDTIDSTITDIYQQRTGASESQITAWLDGTDDGTLFSAKDALHYGFADEVISNKQRKEQVESSVRNRVAAARNRLRLTNRRTA